jgi:hypothetical protein
MLLIAGEAIKSFGHNDVEHPQPRILEKLLIPWP